MNRRQFLGGLLSLPFLSVFAKQAEASPVQAKSSPHREAAGSAKTRVWPSHSPAVRLYSLQEEYNRLYLEGKFLESHPPAIRYELAPKGGVS